MKWIAVDYGERRTGLAVCDASELIVTPVTPQIEEKSLNKVAEAAAAARLAQGAEGVVCGLPRNGGRHSFGQQHLWRRPQSSAGFGFRRSDLGKFSGMAQSPPWRRTAGGCRAHCPGASITRRFSHA